MAVSKDGCNLDFGFAKHPAGQHVRGLKRHDVVGGQHAVEIGDEAVGLAQPHAVERVADRARVGEKRLGLAQADVAHEGRARIRTELVVHVPQHQFGDGQQLIVGIVRKIDVMGDAGTKARRCTSSVSAKVPSTSKMRARNNFMTLSP